MKRMLLILTLCMFVGLLGTTTPSFGQETKTEALLMYNAEKKTPWIGVAAAWIIPSLGHAYAEDWWPRGAKFLAFYVGSIALMVNEETAPIGVLSLIGFRVWEYIDAYGAVRGYNGKLAKKYRLQLSLDKNKPFIQLSYRF